jgi:hypothetical protein
MPCKNAYAWKLQEKMCLNKGNEDTYIKGRHSLKQGSGDHREVPASVTNGHPGCFHEEGAIHLCQPRDSTIGWEAEYCRVA